MKNSKRVSRRNVAQQIGIAAGVSLLSPVIARAAAVTPEQTEGPFYPIDDQADKDTDLTLIEGHADPARGEVVLVRGRVLNTSGEPLDNVLVDIWQANDAGRYSHPGDTNKVSLDPNFQGWGIAKTNAEGGYGFKTIMPGAYQIPAADGGGLRCRHIHFKVSRPGFQDLTTQMYFDGDPLIEQDLVMADTPEDLRHLLIAHSNIDEDTRLPVYRFDIVLVAADTYWNKTYNQGTT